MSFAVILPLPKHFVQTAATEERLAMLLGRHSSGGTVQGLLGPSRRAASAKSPRVKHWGLGRHPILRYLVCDRAMKDV